MSNLLTEIWQWCVFQHLFSQIINLLCGVFLCLLFMFSRVCPHLITGLHLRRTLPVHPCLRPFGQLLETQLPLCFREDTADGRTDGLTQKGNSIVASAKNNDSIRHPQFGGGRKGCLSALACIHEILLRSCAAMRYCHITNNF